MERARDLGHSGWTPAAWAALGINRKVAVATRGQGPRTEHQTGQEVTAGTGSSTRRHAASVGGGGTGRHPLLCVLWAEDSGRNRPLQLEQLDEELQRPLRRGRPRTTLKRQHTAWSRGWAQPFIWKWNAKDRSGPPISIKKVATTAGHRFGTVAIGTPERHMKGTTWCASPKLPRAVQGAKAEN